MKLKSLAFVIIFLLSAVSYHKDSVVCVSKNGVESHLHNESEENLHCNDNNCQKKHHHHDCDDCTDYKISKVDFYNNTKTTKSISLVAINHYNYNIYSYSYKPSLKDDLAKKRDYNTKITYNPILRHIKTVVILT